MPVGQFSFGGHGGKTSLSTKTAAVDFVEIYNALNAALTRTNPPPADKMVVVLDSCYSGGFIDRLKEWGADESKWVVVTAAATDQKAYQPVLSPFDVGFFTQAFVDALARGGSLHDAEGLLPQNLNWGSWNTQKSQLWGTGTGLKLADPDGKSKHPQFGPDGLGAGLPPASAPCSGTGCGPKVRVVSSFDPNEKITQGKGVRGHVKGDAPITFTIWFENDPDLGATAPVQELRVTDALSPLLEWSTFEVALIGFGEHRIMVPEPRDAFTTVAHREGDPYPVDVKAGLDRATGLVTWELASFDTATPASGHHGG